MVTVGASRRIRQRRSARPREPYRDGLGRQVPLAPEWWQQIGGSEPEYYIYKALQRRGLSEGVDFTYQSKQGGGRIQRGGAIVDFLLVNPRVGINVQSLYYHARTSDQRSHDNIVRAMLEGSGIRVEYISEEQAINSPDEAVENAIAGIGGKGPIGL